MKLKRGQHGWASSVRQPSAPGLARGELTAPNRRRARAARPQRRRMARLAETAPRRRRARPRRHPRDCRSWRWSLFGSLSILGCG